MTYRCAIVGVSGGRAHGHADAFAHMPRGTLVAVSTRNAANLRRFGERWEVQARYTDYDRMLREVQPDVVFVNTPPHVRLEILQSAEAHGVPGVIVEKPLALQGEDYLALRQFAARTRLKVAINHQLHFHPRRAQLQELVRSGALGPIQAIRASARMNMAYQGTHVLQAVQAFQACPPQSVRTSRLQGAEGLTETPRMHLAPDCVAADITFADASVAHVQCGLNAPFDDPNDARINTHKQIAVIGAHGSLRWSMTAWRVDVKGRKQAGRHAYAAEDVLGQARMSEAMFDWLERDEAVHPLHLGAALQDFRLLLAIYMSGLADAPQDLEAPPPANLLDALRRKLA